MSYSVELAQALTAVLERVGKYKTHRLAGYAANADFWLDEIAHTLEVLEGYIGRWKKMREATDRWVDEHPLGPSDWDLDTRTPRSIKSSELKEITRQLRSAAKFFLVRCLRSGLLSDQQRRRAEEVLGFEISD